MFLLDYFYGNNKAAQTPQPPTPPKDDEEWVWVDDSTPTPHPSQEDPVQLNRENLLLEHVQLLTMDGSIVAEPGAPPAAEPEAPTTAPTEPQSLMNQSTKLPKLKMRNNNSTSTSMGLRSEVRNVQPNPVAHYSAGHQPDRKYGAPTRKGGRRSGYYKNPSRAARVNNDRKCGGRGF